MCFTQKGRKGEERTLSKKVTYVFSLTKAQTIRQPSDWSRRYRKTGKVCSLILPLQSTNEQKQTIRAIDIGRRKQQVMYAYIYWSENMCSPTNSRLSTYTKRIPIIMAMQCDYVNKGNGHATTRANILIIWRSNCCVDGIHHVDSPTVTTTMPAVTKTTNWWNHGTATTKVITQLTATDKARKQLRKQTKQ